EAQLGFWRPHISTPMRECQFTAGGKTSLLDYTILHVIDDMDVCSYDKHNKQVVVKESWMSLHFLQCATWLPLPYQRHSHPSHTLYSNGYQTRPDSHHNHTLQFFMGCEVDNDIDIGHSIQFAMDGEDFMKIDDQNDDWTVMKPEAEPFKSLAESNFGSKIRDKAMKKFCFHMMRKILQYSSMKENGKFPVLLGPGVTVPRHDAPDGRVMFNCTATGFYPRSIQLHWEKDGQLGVWGQESSSGTLPNADSTLYLQISLELPPGDSETDYTCVVEHRTLQTPAVYPVPEKTTVQRPWVMTLSVLTVIVRVLSCAEAFITWKKKKKTGIRVMRGGKTNSARAR
uniref:Ig-like domain-containing protein n=1 Tax=Vombatus ursinus TaxID=29139 RepID=A0A4X2KP50_VOMUR